MALYALPEDHYLAYQYGYSLLDPAQLAGSVTVSMRLPQQDAQLGKRTQGR